jgi:hypothetical protein
LSNEVRFLNPPNEKQKARRKGGLLLESLFRAGSGLFAPSMGLTPAHFVLRGQRFALSKFAPGKFVERGPIPEPSQRKTKSPP